MKKKTFLHSSPCNFIINKKKIIKKHSEHTRESEIYMNSQQEFFTMSYYIRSNAAKKLV